jgi:hypothetical protein
MKYLQLHTAMWTNLASTMLNLKNKTRAHTVRSISHKVQKEAKLTVLLDVSVGVCKVAQGREERVEGDL